MNLVTKTWLWSLVEFAIIAAILFFAAGTVAWPAGWAFVVLFIAYVIPTIVWLLRTDPGVIEERMSLRPVRKSSDEVFVGLLLLFFVVWLVLMPLDAVRYRWSHVPVWVQVIGAILLLLSFYLFFLVFRENPYLSGIVRVQKERGHHAITTGPYRYVRHPMYAGAVLYFLGTALLLGSGYGALATVPFTVLLVVRTVFEERTLRAELPGYEAYLAQVKYRFLPYVW